MRHIFRFCTFALPLLFDTKSDGGQKKRNEYLISDIILSCLLLHSTAGWSSIACVTPKKEVFFPSKCRTRLHATRSNTQISIDFVFFLSKQLRSVQWFGTLCYVALPIHCVAGSLHKRSVLAYGFNILSNVQSFDGLRLPWLCFFSRRW